MESQAMLVSTEGYYKAKDGLQLDAYLNRIRYNGSLAPTLQTLIDLHYHHVLAITFENLFPFLKKHVLLDLDSLQRKIVDGGKGGYCFEQNQLFYQVLVGLGFSVKGLSARVLWNVPPSVTTARAHMLLLVQLPEGAFIADVGFGGLTLPSPLLLQERGEQKTSHESFRIDQEEEEYVLMAKIQNSWKPMYRFTLQEQSKADYEVANWFTSTHPRSPFVNGLMIAKTTTEARYGLRNNELSIHSVSGKTEKHILTSPSQLKTVLQEVFQVNLEDTPEVEAALTALLHPIN